MNRRMTRDVSRPFTDSETQAEAVKHYENLIQASLRRMLREIGKESSRPWRMALARTEGRLRG